MTGGAALTFVSFAGGAPGATMISDQPGTTYAVTVGAGHVESSAGSRVRVGSNEHVGSLAPEAARV
jgi:hypothetical protein